MAVWQFPIQFVSRRKVLECFGQIPLLLSDYQIDENDLYDGVELPPKYEEVLGKLGKKIELKWLTYASNWGDYDKGTHLTIFNPMTTQTSVFSRFDCRQVGPNLC